MMGSKYTKVKPIPWPLRKVVPLTIGGEYFVTYDGRKIKKGKLLKVFEVHGDLFVHLLLESGYTIAIYADELGLTEKQACEHEITY
jgi:hypothetical protein